MSFNNAKNFFEIKLSDERMKEDAEKRDSEGRVRVAMFSDFFSAYDRSPMYTNGMYEGLKNEIISSLELYKTRERIDLTVYEAKPSDELDREYALIGFKKYISLCAQKKKNYVLNRTIIFSLFAVVGVLCIYLSNIYAPDRLIPWVANCLNNVGCVFLWNFVGYFAFQYSGEKREYARLKQIQNIRFEFSQWE